MVKEAAEDARVREDVVHDGNGLAREEGAGGAHEVARLGCLEGGGAVEEREEQRHEVVAGGEGA